MERQEKFEDLKNLVQDKFLSIVNNKEQFNKFIDFINKPYIWKFNLNEQIQLFIDYDIDIVRIEKVASYDDFINMGRQVKKGEKSISYIFTKGRNIPIFSEDQTFIKSKNYDENINTIYRKLLNSEIEEMENLRIKETNIIDNLFKDSYKEFFSVPDFKKINNEYIKFYMYLSKVNDMVYEDSLLEIKKYKEDKRNNNTTNKSETSFNYDEISNNFNNEYNSCIDTIKDYSDDEKKEKFIEIYDKAPYTLQMIGIDKNAKIKISYSAIEHIDKHFDKETKENIIKQIPNILANPICILNGSQKDSLVFVSEIKIGNDNVIIPLHLDTKTGDYTIYNVPTVYEKWNTEYYLEKEFIKHNVVAFNQEKMKSFRDLYDRLSLPKRDECFIYNDSIAQNQKTVKDRLIKPFTWDTLTYDLKPIGKITRSEIEEVLKLKDGESYHFDIDALFNSENIKIFENFINDKVIEAKEYYKSIGKYVEAPKAIKENKKENDTQDFIDEKSLIEITFKPSARIYSYVSDKSINDKSMIDTFKELSTTFLKAKLTKEEIISFLNKNEKYEKCFNKCLENIFLYDSSSAYNTFKGYFLEYKDMVTKLKELVSYENKNEIHKDNEEELLAEPQKQKTKKIDDFGKKIGGAKKDLWKERGILIDDIDSMNTAEMIKYVTKENVWKKPDYMELIKSGIPKEVVYFYKNVYDALPKTFEISLKEKENSEFVNEQARNYIECISLIKNRVLQYKNMEQVKGFTEYFVTMFLDTEHSYIKRVKDKYKRISLNKLYKKAQYFEFYQNYMINKMNRIEFGVEKEQKQNSNRKAYKSKFKYKPLDSIKREGQDYRDGNDAKGEDFIAEFNLYGGEFGNWETQEERQKNLNFAYDSFKDLATALNIEPQDISFGGKLSIGFGSRGHGKALAHYEANRNVINLTKMKGAGSLAHEYGHFVDNAICTLITNNTLEFASDNMICGYVKQINEKVPAYEELVRTMKYNNDNSKTRFFSDAEKLDSEFSKEDHGYWSSNVELLARAFACYVKDKLKEKGIENDYLTGHADAVISVDKDGKPVNGFPIGEERKKINECFDKVFEQIREKILINNRNPYLEALNDNTEVKTVDIETKYREYENEKKNSMNNNDIELDKTINDKEWER